MKRFCIMYNTIPEGTAQYWVYAESRQCAKNLFKTDFLRGELDYESDGTIAKIIESN